MDFSETFQKDAIGPKKKENVSFIAVAQTFGVPWKKVWGHVMIFAILSIFRSYSGLDC